MAEKLYTIPVNEAFEADSECPVCTMYRSLEQDAIDFTMGPSYMEDDVRIATNQLGFCESHIKLLYKKQNRLGLALMMLSHMDRTRAEMEKIRGVSSDSAMNKLLEYNLIEDAGRMDAPGRPVMYQTTDEFLKMFGYKSLKDLPDLPKLKEELEQLEMEEANEGEKD